MPRVTRVIVALAALALLAAGCGSSNGSGAKKPATKAREGINPFTKEPTIFKAKPARKVIKARPVKAAKDALL